MSQTWGLQAQGSPEPHQPQPRAHLSATALTEPACVAGHLSPASSRVGLEQLAKGAAAGTARTELRQLRGHAGRGTPHTLFGKTCQSFICLACCPPWQGYGMWGQGSLSRPTPLEKPAAQLWEGCRHLWASPLFLPQDAAPSSPPPSSLPGSHQPPSPLV